MWTNPHPAQEQRKKIKCKTQGTDTFKNSTFLHVNVCPIFSKMLTDILNFEMECKWATLNIFFVKTCWVLQYIHQLVCYVACDISFLTITQTSMFSLESLDFCDLFPLFFFLFWLQAGEMLFFLLPAPSCRVGMEC